MTTRDYTASYKIDWNWADHKAHGYQGGIDIEIPIRKKVKAPITGKVSLIGGGASIKHVSGWTLNARDGVGKVLIHQGSTVTCGKFWLVVVGSQKWLHYDFTRPDGVRVDYSIGFAAVTEYEKKHGIK